MCVCVGGCMWVCVCVCVCRVLPKKLYLIPPSLTLRNIRYISRVKWSNPGKGVASPPPPLCISIGKGSLLVTLDYGHQLYLLYIIIIIMSRRQHGYP